MKHQKKGLKDGIITRQGKMLNLFIFKMKIVCNTGFISQQRFQIGMADDNQHHFPDVYWFFRREIKIMIEDGSYRRKMLDDDNEAVIID